MKARNQLAAAVAAAGPVFVLAASGFALPPPSGPCSASGTTLTCQGDLSGGVAESSGAYDTLLVNSLTSQIKTTAIPGIYFSTANLAMTLHSATGPFGISTTGDDAAGIDISSRVLRIDAPASTFTAGNIAVRSDDTIVTTGEYSYGISVDFVTSAIDTGPSARLSTAGGKLSVTSAGSITTNGLGAYGIDAFNSVTADASQPGGFAEATGQDIVANGARVVTNGAEAAGVLARQTLSVRADFTADATGGDLRATGELIATHGDDSSGVGAHSFSLAQSAFDAASITGGAISVEGISVDTSGARSLGLLASFVGIATGFSAADVTADEVRVRNRLAVSTLGSQSIGMAGSIYGSALTSIGNAGVSGAAVRIDNVGLVETRGAGAHGIAVDNSSIAESFDASGTASAETGLIAISSAVVRTKGAGSMGISATAAATADGGASGDAHAAGIAITARNVTVEGAGSTGIYARNTAENMSSAGSAVSDGVTVKVTGALKATGVNSVGIDIGAEAIGVGASVGQSRVLLDHVSSVLASSDAIRFATDGDFKVDNYGTLTSLDGFAIVSGAGDDTVANGWKIVGDVDLKGGANTFSNYVHSTFETNKKVFLGAGGVLSNDGILSPGGSGRIVTTKMTGDLVQSGTGSYHVDVDYAGGVADKIEITSAGSTAALAGTVIVTAANLGGAITPGAIREFEILSAAGGVTDNGLNTTAGSAVVDYSLRFDAAGNRVLLGAAIDFAKSSALTANQENVGRALNTAMAAGASGATLDLMRSLFALSTDAALAAAYDSLSPQIYGSLQSQVLLASDQFANEMKSCRVDNWQPNSAIREGECLWARASARQTDTDGSAGAAGSSSNVGSFTAGLQVAMATDWKAGVALGYDTISASSGAGGSSEGDRVNIGAVVKYNPGSSLLAAGVAAGWGDFENTTFAVVGPPTKSNSDTDTVSGWLHAAHLFDQGGWYVKPLIDARLTQIDFSGATGAGGIRVLGGDTTMFSVSPALELGTQFRLDQVSVWRPFIRAGVTWIDDPTFVTRSAIGGAVFSTVTTGDDVLLDLSAGVDVINTEGAALRFQYDGRFGSDTTQNSVSLKGSVPF